MWCLRCPIRPSLGGNNGSPASRKFAVVAHALVDDIDADLTSLHWSLGACKRKDGSLRDYVRRKDGNKQIYLHRLIAERMGLGNAPEIDHIDRDRLNNQRSNLRPVTHHQNHMNKSKAPGTSQYRGVSYYKRGRKWLAQIHLGDGTKEGKKVHLGYFSTELEAAIAYDEAAIKNFGEFANLNVLPQ